MMEDRFDFHTHHQDAPAGKAIINIEREVLLCPEAFVPREGALYSVGIHPWWTEEEELPLMMKGMERLLEMKGVVAIGECGWDALRGAEMGTVRGRGKERTRGWTQTAVMEWQVELSENYGLPVIVHCVRAWHLLLAAHKAWQPNEQWTVHGFRGKPALAQQLLDAGVDLSFGQYYNAASYALVPKERRHVESDDGRMPEVGDSDRIL